MTIVAPSLLACDFLNIEAELKAFDSVKDFLFLLDIMDGHFVPNLTFGHPIVEKISKLLNLSTLTSWSPTLSSILRPLKITAFTISHFTWKLAPLSQKF